jgi:hypothetical protein
MTERNITTHKIQKFSASVSIFTLVFRVKVTLKNSPAWGANARARLIADGHPVSFAT